MRKFKVSAKSVNEIVIIISVSMWKRDWETSMCCIVQEALLVRQCKERRIAFSEGSTYNPAVISTCKHVGDACTAPALPLSKYCLQRILTGFWFQLMRA